MFRKSMLAVAAALIFGSVSAALADEHFDVNIYRASPQSPAFATYMGALGSYAQVQTPRRTTLRAPSSAEETWFAKGSYAGW